MADDAMERTADSGQDGSGPAWRHGREWRTAVWREQAIAEITGQEFLVDQLVRQPTRDGAGDAEAASRISQRLDTARQAAVDQGLSRRQRLVSAMRGASVERTWGHIDAAEEALLRVAPDDFVKGQLPRVLRRVQRSLEPDDPRRVRLEDIARRQGGMLTEEDRKIQRLSEGIGGDAGNGGLTGADREVLVAAFHAANGETRRRQTRVRSFRNMLYLCAIVLTVAAAGLALLGFVRPDLAPLCFQPSGQVVCPTQLVTLPPGSGVGDQPPTGQPPVDQTIQEQARQDELARRTADPVDMFLIELIGLVAAAVAAAIALRDLRGTSTPYGVPLALAVLKLPTGALTAALGLLLMRGQFVPGLTALDSPSQIIAWAIVFGYAQQLFTRFVDQRAHSVLESAGGNSPQPAEQPWARAGAAATT